MTDPDERWFADFPVDQTPLIFSHRGKEIPLGHVLLDLPHLGGCCQIGVTLGDDTEAPIPFAATLALAGAELIVNPTAATTYVGRYEKRRANLLNWCKNLNCAYLYSGAGPSESTTTAVCDGYRLICENGDVLAEHLSLNDNLDNATLIDVMPIDLEHYRDHSTWKSLF